LETKRAFRDVLCYRLYRDLKRGWRIIAPNLEQCGLLEIRSVALQTKGLNAGEHTAQVPYETRVQREDAFRATQLPVLFCSPTMELGIDIAELNVVNMRNVPPTPANYAQRNGRVGRSGQPALVFTYCATGNSHDQYFFKRPERMVAGAVSTPRLDLGNEDLVLAHVQAIWLAETGLDLGSPLRQVLDVKGNPSTLPLLASVQGHRRRRQTAPARRYPGRACLGLPG